MVKEEKSAVETNSDSLMIDPETGGWEHRHFTFQQLSEMGGWCSTSELKQTQEPVPFGRSEQRTKTTAAN